jgi:hypothetical protein
LAQICSRESLAVDNTVNRLCTGTVKPLSRLGFSPQIAFACEKRRDASIFNSGKPARPSPVQRRRRLVEDQKHIHRAAAWLG